MRFIDLLVHCNLCPTQLPEPMETVSEETKPAAAAKTEESAAVAAAPLPLQPEVEIYLRLVTTIALVDNKLFDDVWHLIHHQVARAPPGSCSLTRHLSVPRLPLAPRT